MDVVERADDVRSQAGSRLESAIAKAKEVCSRLQEQTTAAAKAADKTVRERPYHAIGIAFGLGILIGVLALRRNRD